MLFVKLIVLGNCWYNYENCHRPNDFNEHLVISHFTLFHNIKYLLQG